MHIITQHFSTWPSAYVHADDLLSTNTVSLYRECNLNHQSSMLQKINVSLAKSCLVGFFQIKIVPSTTQPFMGFMGQTLDFERLGVPSQHGPFYTYRGLVTISMSIHLYQ